MSDRRRRLLGVESFERRDLLAALADLDADGDLDLVTESGWHENADTHGNFEVHEFGASLLVKAADLDGDGDLDLAAANGWRENLDGLGNFSDLRLVPLPDGFLPKALRIQDAGADGDIDILVHDGEQAIHLNNVDGKATFELGEGLLLPNLADIADVDNDGRIDALKLEDRGIWIYRNEGGGELQPTLWYEDVWFENNNGLQGEQIRMKKVIPVEDYLTADVDNDGRSDLISLTNAGVYWRSGFFGTDQLISDERDQISIADLDQDGDLDVISNLHNRLVWNENLNGQGTFGDTQTLGRGIISADIHFESANIHVADFTGDGRADVIANQISRGITVFEQRVTGDSNRDGVFDSSDLVSVFVHAEYEDDVHRNSTFEMGDWNGDREFDSSDLNFAFQAGNYVVAARPRGAEIAAAVEWMFSRDDSAKNARAFVA